MAATARMDGGGHRPRLQGTLKAAFEQRRVPVGDGRRLLLAEYGQRSSCPVLFVHGFMGSRLGPLLAGEIKGNVIAMDRPGYGGSSPLPEPSLKGFGRDIEAMLDALKIDDCAILAVSTGAPFAIGAAAVLGARVRHVVLACPVGGPDTVMADNGSISLLRRLRLPMALLRRTIRPLFFNIRHYGLDVRFVKRTIKTETPYFKPTVSPLHVQRMLVSSFREGARSGMNGVLADIMILTSDWDVDPSVLNVDVTIFNGDSDTVTPPCHAIWYEERLQTARRIELSPCGHISLVVNEMQRMIDAAAAPR